VTKVRGASLALASKFLHIPTRTSRVFGSKDMTEEVAAPEPVKAPGPLRRALFQDVPYILDSLWRWTEFRANRIGTVDFQGEHRFRLRPAWLSGCL
jgi:hypothetical protein